MCKRSLDAVQQKGRAERVSKAVVTFHAAYRWLEPLAKVAMVASKDVPDEAEPAGRDENSAAAANTKQEADATKQAHQEQAALLRAEHPFVKAVASAAALAKVDCLRPLVSGAAQHSVLVRHSLVFC